MVDYKRTFKIITNKGVSDRNSELKIIESNSEKNIYLAIGVGALLLFLAVLW